MLRPFFLSFGSKRLSASFNTFQITQFSFNNAVLRSLVRSEFSPDAICAHFLLPSGHAALQLARILKKPVFCFLGESDITNHETKFNYKQIQALFRQFDLLIPNSYSIAEILTERYQINTNSIKVIPNGVNKNVFSPRDQNYCREKLGYDSRKKIIIFVGSFIERKGPLRALAACNMLNPKPQMIFIGEGDQVPEDENILFRGSLPQEELPFYLNAADVFLLPTSTEGMPNAILEAMSCNLPIVTSPIPVNRFLLGDNHPFFAPSHSETKIADALSRALLAGGIMSYEKNFSLDERARQISQAFSARC